MTTHDLVTPVNGQEAETRSDADRQSEIEKRQMAELGVAFDGRQYCYREYRYEVLADALNYARLERSRPGYQVPLVVQPAWRGFDEPSAEQRRQMAELGVSFDGRHFRYAEYRYDHLADALNYAKLQR
jgi:hypothetical protein